MLLASVMLHFSHYPTCRAHLYLRIMSRLYWVVLVSVVVVKSIAHEENGSRLRKLRLVDSESSIVCVSEVVLRLS